ncbi:Chloride channel protein 2 [Halocaridina rubra]|uniref:Chloride channel protein 2 n=1 Tax=Halocaridina rubra TaxID=373956 RepID=A0AAN8XMC8_HALRR
MLNVQLTETISPLFKVEHNFIYPYDVIELLPFLCIGIMCGFAGSLFVYLHRRYVMFMRHNRTLKNFLQKKRLLYPTFVAIIFSSMTFPKALGQFMAATLPPSKQILHLFSNVTWTVTDPDKILSPEQENILKHWMPSLDNNFHISLFVFQIVTVIQIAISSTLPLPNGMLIPLFKVGAAFGRQIGELMVALYPLGITAGHPIVPGAYAMVGAASFCAAITHTISISVIVFELTGQITYVIPIMIGVLISNCISSLLQPSIYDSMIRIKKLPYLPDIIATTSADVYNIYVEDIMVRDIKCIWYGITYVDLKKVLKENRKLKYLPLVDKPDSMILLGSVQRIELVRILVEQISTEKRHKEAKHRHIEALKKRWEEEDAAGDSKQSKIRYEDEINDNTETAPTTPSLIHRFSRSLSRSLSRSRSASRSRSRSRSVSRSRHGTPSSDSEDSSTSPPGSPASTRSKRDSPTPPGSPSSNRIKEMFPSRSPATRKSSRFSISKVDKDGNKSGSENETDGKGSSSGSGKSKKRSALDKLRSSSSKKKDTSAEKEKDPVNALRRRSTLKRSNSLDSLNFRSISNEDAVDGKDPKSDGPVTSPKKGILKRRNSFSLGTTTTPVTPSETVYQTITVGDTRLRSAFEKVRKMRMETASSMEFKLSQLSLFKSKKKDQNKKTVLDLTDEERSLWEQAELAKEVDFTKCHIDPAPFQLVERTSLLRVHSMFSMLGINHAYVTAIGRLIGVVALKELRMAIEGQYVGQAQQRSTPQQVSSPNTPTSPLRSSLGSGASPQRISNFNPTPYGDIESGTLTNRGSRTHLINYANNSNHS